MCSCKNLGRATVVAEADVECKKVVVVTGNLKGLRPFSPLPSQEGNVTMSDKADRCAVSQKDEIVKRESKCAGVVPGLRPRLYL